MKKIKVSDYIVKFLEDIGVKHVFLISGGGNIHLIDSIGNSKKIKYICNHHEQACSIAAEAYSRTTGSIGVSIVTSGPGGTNAITGVYGAWTDSIPVLVISGQIRTETMGAGRDGLRQLGDQEINIIDMVKYITKYSVTITKAKEIRFHLEKAYFLAKNGRPGPVWLDIPLNIQGAFVDENNLKKFNSAGIEAPYETDKEKLGKIILKTLIMLGKSKRPVILVGNGVRLSNSEKELLDLIKKLDIPVLTSFAGYDLVGSNKNFYGRIGIFGQRAANFIIQNSDFLLALGTRLPVRTVGFRFDAFARKAYKVVVDIDKKELSKKIVNPDLPINYNVKDFIIEMMKQLKKRKIKKEFSEWIDYCKKINRKYSTIPRGEKDIKNYVSPYVFIDRLSEFLTPSDRIAVSDGTALIVTYQTLKFKQGLRVILNSGCAAMGYGLPAAIGVCLASGKKNTICLEGDGSIQLNIQELQTIFYHKLPIKIFVYNNQGYVSIRLTQKNLFEGKFIAADPKSGVSCPDILKVAKAYGIMTERIKNNMEIRKKIKKVLKYKGPVVCEVVLSPDHEFIPKSASKKLSDGSFVSRPLEDMYPFLERNELKENMIIPLLPESLKE